MTAKIAGYLANNTHYTVYSYWLTLRTEAVANGLSLSAELIIVTDRVFNPNIIIIWLFFS